MRSRRQPQLDRCTQSARADRLYSVHKHGFCSAAAAAAAGSMRLGDSASWTRRLCSSKQQQWLKTSLRRSRLQKQLVKVCELTCCFPGNTLTANTSDDYSIAEMCKYRAEAASGADLSQRHKDSPDRSVLILTPIYVYFLPYRIKCRWSEVRNVPPCISWPIITMFGLKRWFRTSK